MADDEDAAPRGAAFYEDPTVFSRYIDHRRDLVGSPNHVMEEPAFLAALGDVGGLRMLDLGCGDGALGQRVLDAGASSYVGVDGALTMVSSAAPELDVRHCDIEDFEAPPGTFDLVVSRLALHYVEDLASVLTVCRRVLTPAGRLLITVLHPNITSHDARADTEDLRGSWVVDDYFDRGPRPQSWLGGSVTWHHRTVDDYVAAVLAAGFRLDGLSECAPLHERFEGDEAEYRRRRRIPMFLLLSARVA
jgi:SAM-dependent methyltransferase